MGVFRTSFQGLKPVIFVCWIVAAVRIVLEASTTKAEITAAASVYFAVATLFLFAGFTGHLDHLVWKPLLAGAFVLGVLCWFVPNAIAYSVAQFQGWGHGRFYVDQEHWAIQERLMEDQGMGWFEAEEQAAEELGRESETRGAPIAETAAGKLRTGVQVALLTTIGGTVWSLVLGVFFVGLPAMRRRALTQAFPKP